MIGYTPLETYHYRLVPKNRKLYELEISFVDGAEIPAQTYATLMGDTCWLQTANKDIVSGIGTEKYILLAIHSPGDGTRNEILVSDLFANEPGFIHAMMALFLPTPAYDIKAIMRAVRILVKNPKDILKATRGMMPTTAL